MPFKFGRRKVFFSLNRNHFFTFGHLEKTIGFCQMWWMTKAKVWTAALHWTFKKSAGHSVPFVFSKANQNLLYWKGSFAEVADSSGHGIHFWVPKLSTTELQKPSSFGQEDWQLLDCASLISAWHSPCLSFGCLCHSCHLLRFHFSSVTFIIYVAGWNMYRCRASR